MKIFNRAGVTVHPVIADSGTMGGKNSTEFQAPAAIGEDTIATNEKGTYAANLEMAKSIDTFKQEPEEAKELAKVATPGMDTIEKLADFLKVPSTRIVKSILYIADDQKVLVLIRGDKEINEVKLGHILDADEVRTTTHTSSSMFRFTPEHSISAAAAVAVSSRLSPARGDWLIIS